MTVTVGKTPYARFDLNDYSTPHPHVRRTLSVLADEQRVRILDGTRELACHPRSWDRGARIEDASHVQSLVDHKRAARAHRACDRLAQAVPASTELLQRAGARGHNLGSITAALMRLLERYGARALQTATLEALERDVPHPNVPFGWPWSALARPPASLRRWRWCCPNTSPAGTRRCARTTWLPTTARRTLMTKSDATMSPQGLPHARLPERQLREQASELRLHGLVARWSEVMSQPEQASWVAQWLGWEATERHRRSLERRLRAAHIGRFKSLADFDWHWPTQCDRAAVEGLMALDFLKDASNVVLVGPNGVGKTMCACNLGYQAALAGHTALFITAAQLLGELAALDSDSALRRRLRLYAAPDVLIIDEVGYLSYSNRHADLLFELVNRRYQNKSIVLTTNRAFAEWGEVFPNAACVVSLIDRLMHRAEVVRIEGKSYRQKEADEREAARKAERLAKQAPSRGRKAAVS